MDRFPNKPVAAFKKTECLRQLFEETRPVASDFILPLFLKEGIKSPEAISSILVSTGTA